MNEQLNEVLSRVAIDTFEKLAFMFAFPDEGDGTAPLEEAVCAGVGFSGPFSGEVDIRISDAVLPELGANMLGMDDEQNVTTEQKQDALKEALNVICGNFLPAIAGEEPIFNMEMPRILSLNEISDSEPLMRVRLEFDEGICDVLVFVEGEIPDGVLCVD